MNLLVAADLLEKRRGLGMFVKSGAQERVTQRRQDMFYKNYIVSLVQEAQKLGLTEEQLWQLIQRGWNKDERTKD